MKNNYFIIHGSFGSPFVNWIPWLRKELEEENSEVYTPDFPTGVGYQNYNNWSKLSFVDKMKRRFNIAKHQFNESSNPIINSVGAIFGEYDPENPDLNTGVVYTPSRATPQQVQQSAKLMETINNYWKNLGKLKIRLGGNGKYASGILTKP